MPNFRSEFRLKQFGFSNITYDRIFFSQWRIPPIVLIIYKLILATYVDVWLVITANYYGAFMGSYPWSVWLTNWTYVLLVVYLNVSTLAMIVYHLVRLFTRRPVVLCSISPEDHRSLMLDGEQNTYTTELSIHSSELNMDNPPDTSVVRSAWFVAVPWILHDMACSFVPCVSLMFFAILWPYQRHANGIDMDNLQLHGINTVVMLLDFAVHAVPVRVLHVIYPVIYGSIYVVFSAIYWSGDHSRVIYPVILDWNNPGTTTGVVFGVLVGLIVLQFLLFGLHKLKTLIYDKVHCCAER